MVVAVIYYGIVNYQRSEPGAGLTTDYHAKLFAHELTRRRSVADAEKFAGALLDAPVDLNPHQVEAALFSFKSPFPRVRFSLTKSD